MEDNKILELFFARNEDAIRHTDEAYGRRLYAMANNILKNGQDAEESVSDTYMAAWKSMPPKRPSILATFLGKITRRLSIDRWRSRNRYKRGGGEIVLALEELEDCIAADQTVEKAYERKQLALVFNRFLESLPETERQVFLCRYWYLDSISVIANYYGFSDSKVTSILHRTRKKLRAVLEKEDLL